MVSKDAPPPPRRPPRLRRPRLPSLASLRGVRLSGLSMRRGSAGRDFFDNIIRWSERRDAEAGRGQRRDRDRGRGGGGRSRDVVARRESAFRWPDVDLRRGSGGGGGGGLLKGCLSACCCCGCCCCCLNMQYLRTVPGMLRLAQLTLSWICNWLLGRYALRVSGTLGSAMPAFFLASAGGALGCSLLLAVALLSTKSVSLLRASLFEIAFHATAVGLYASQASYLHVATSIYLEPYKNDLETYTYPAIVTSYWLGYFLAALHSLDTVYSLKHYGRFRC